MLTDAGLEVDLAGGLETALARMRARRHRLAVIDLSLGAAGPGNQDGLSVIWAIRREDPGCAAILLTGFATVELAVSALKDYGAYTCLQKDSFRRAQFRELLGRVLAAPPLVGQGDAAGAPERPVAGPMPMAVLPGSPGAHRLALLVEDDPGWRSILGELLDEAGCRVRACSSYGEALGYLRREAYAVAVVDLALASSSSPLANRDGYRVLARVRKANVAAIVVSGTALAGEVERAYADHGIFAYFEKQAFDRQAFLSLTLESLAAGQPGPDDLALLTPRERDVLELLAQGMTNKDIAAHLVISPNTVKRYLKSVFEKLDVDTRAAAAAKASVARRG
jgi:DNA-binding NarL/FixJ family response regulator